MATVMVDRVTGQQSCTLADLLRAGFSDLDIIHHKGEAQRMATARLRERGLDVDTDVAA
jgi:hypothetical protein